MTKQKEPHKKWSEQNAQERLIHVLSVLIVLGLIVGLPVWIFASNANSPDPAPTPILSELGRSWAVDPATRAVEYTVTNTAQEDHRISCLIKVQNAKDTYRGSDSFYPGVLRAKETKTFNALLSINDQGAAYITAGSVYCDTLRP